jgi:hypothetical protein
MNWPTARVTTNSGIPNRSAMGREFQDVYADSRLEDVVGWIASNGQPCPASGQADLASRSTDGSQAGWFTPSVEDAARTGSKEAWEEYERDGRTTQARLRNQIWAMPQASDPAHAGPNQRDSSGRPALPAQVNKQGSGKLNPHWVFCLMGYPPLWAEIGRKFTTASRS